MQKINILAIFKLIIFSVLIALISLSPSLKILPRSIIITSFHDNQRLIELICISLVLLYSCVFNKNKTHAPINPTIRYVIYILIILALTSASFARSPRHAMIEVSIFIGLCYLALFIIDLYRENSNLLVRALIYAFWVSILLFMLSFYTGYITATIFKTAVNWPNPLTGFSSIRSFNQYQLWTFGLTTLPLLVYEFKSKSTHLLLNIALVAWAVLLFYSASRGALLALIFGMLLTTIIYKNIAWPFIRLQTIYLSLGFLSYKILFELVPYLRESTLVTGTVMRDTTNDRIELWLQAANLIVNNPVLGIGPMHFAWYSKISAHPHNSILQLMCEWGLPAATLIIGIASYGLFCWLKKINIQKLETCDQFNQNLAVALFFTLTTSAIYSLVDGVIVMPISQVMMFTVIGLMIGYASEKPDNTSLKSNSLARPIFASIVLVSLVCSTLPEILQSAADSEKRFSIGYLAAGPRLWTEVKTAP